MKKQLKQLKKGDIFKLKDSETAPYWVRGHYCREDKTYSIYKYDDVCHEIFRNGRINVFVD